MIVYKVFYKNFELKKGEFMGMLIERRKDMRGKNQIESAMRWAKLVFGRMVQDGKTIFVVPSELKLGINTRWIIEKGIFTKEEILGMSKPIEASAVSHKQVDLFFHSRSPFDKLRANG